MPRCDTSIRGRRLLGGRIFRCVDIDPVNETDPRRQRYHLTGQTRSAQDQRELGLFFFVETCPQGVACPHHARRSRVPQHRPTHRHEREYSVRETNCHSVIKKVRRASIRQMTAALRSRNLHEEVRGQAPSVPRNRQNLFSRYSILIRHGSRLPRDLFRISSKPYSDRSVAKTCRKTGFPSCATNSTLSRMLLQLADRRSVHSSGT
jgi:hypothetical protein